MKKINLYDYQQEMLENITKALTGRAQVTFYDQHGKKMKVGNSVKFGIGFSAVFPLMMIVMLMRVGRMLKK